MQPAPLRHAPAGQTLQIAALYCVVIDAERQVGV